MKTYRTEALLDGLYIGLGIGLLIFGGWLVPWLFGLMAQQVANIFNLTPSVAGVTYIGYVRLVGVIVGIILIAVGIISEVHYRGKLKANQSSHEKIDTT